MLFSFLGLDYLSAPVIADIYFECRVDFGYGGKLLLFLIWAACLENDE